MTTNNEDTLHPDAHKLRKLLGLKPRGEEKVAPISKEKQKASYEFLERLFTLIMKHARNEDLLWAAQADAVEHDGAVDFEDVTWDLLLYENIELQPCDCPKHDHTLSVWDGLHIDLLGAAHDLAAESMIFKTHSCEEDSPVTMVIIAGFFENKAVTVRFCSEPPDLSETGYDSRNKKEKP